MLPDGRAPPPSLRCCRLPPSCALVSDVVELERALRQLLELQVVDDVRATLGLTHGSQGACSPADTTNDSTGDVTAPTQAGGRSTADGATTSPLATPAALLLPPLCEAQAEELQFQKAWLCYVWGRAALSGIQPQVRPGRTCGQAASHLAHVLCARARVCAAQADDACMG